MCAASAVPDQRFMTADSRSLRATTRQRPAAALQADSYWAGSTVDHFWVFLLSTSDRAVYVNRERHRE